MVEEDLRSVPRPRFGKTEECGYVVNQRSGGSGKDRSRRSELLAGPPLRTDAEPAGTQRRRGEADKVRRGRLRLYRSDCELVRVGDAACIGSVACQAVLATDNGAGNACL